MKALTITTTIIRHLVATGLSIRYILQLFIDISNITFFFQDGSNFMLNSSKMNELHPKDRDEIRESSTMVATRSVSIINDF